MLSKSIVTFNNVWKKYSKHNVLNNCLRDELVSMFTGNKTCEGLGGGEFWALQDINLSIKKGCCLGVSGHNGSGKSTMLKLISNITYPTKGEIYVRGKVAPLIELGAGMHPDLTGVENIYMNGAILGLSMRELKRVMGDIVEFSGLGDFVHVPVKKYSSGMYLRLAFSIAVHSTAEIFLFDEVFAVGDQEFQEKCIIRINEIRNIDKTIIIISHDMYNLHTICDEIIFIDHGMLVD